MRRISFAVGLGILGSIGDNSKGGFLLDAALARTPALLKGELMDWSSAFETALPYSAFLDRHASATQRTRWESMHDRVRLEPDQVTLLGGFVRRMPVLVLAGAWCGDCVNQCPIFARFAEASPAIELRFLDRDALPEVADALAINGGRRVPMVLFLSEDYREVARYGERTLFDLSTSRCRTTRPRLPHRIGPADRRRHPACDIRMARGIRASPAHPPTLAQAPGEVRGLTPKVEARVHPAEARRWRAPTGPEGVEPDGGVGMNPRLLIYLEARGGAGGQARSPVSLEG